MTMATSASCVPAMFQAARDAIIKYRREGEGQFVFQSLLPTEFNRLLIRSCDPEADRKSFTQWMYTQSKASLEETIQQQRAQPVVEGSYNINSSAVWTTGKFPATFP
jgi:hypothetical protein